MNRSDTSKALAIVKSLWPHSTLGPDPEGTLATWQAMLASATVDEVADSLRRLAGTGREHAPPVGVVANDIGVHRQANAPSIDDAQKQLARLMARCVPAGASTPEDTAEAVERFQAAGVHEAVLRFVAERGIFAVRMMPMGDEFALDANQSADRRDLARHYRDVTLPGWRADPRPGLALERARQALGPGRRGDLRPVDPARHLGA